MILKQTHNTHPALPAVDGSPHTSRLVLGTCTGIKLIRHYPLPIVVPPVKKIIRKPSQQLPNAHKDIRPTLACSQICMGQCPPGDPVRIGYLYLQTPQSLHFPKFVRSAQQNCVRFGTGSERIIQICKIKHTSKNSNFEVAANEVGKKSSKSAVCISDDKHPTLSLADLNDFHSIWNGSHLVLRVKGLNYTTHLSRFHQ